MRNNKKGFTLVEIMIVVVIIGLLAALAIPAFNTVRERSIRRTVINDGKQLGHAAQQYYLEHGVLTVDLNSIVGDGLYVEDLSTGNTVTGGFPLGTEGDFTIENAGAGISLSFDSEGDLN